MTNDSSQQSQAITHGIHHLGLSVPDIEATAAFFITTLGYQKDGEKPDYPAIFVSDGTVMLTLWQVASPENCRAFNRRENVGLHHFAMNVESRAALKTLYLQFLELDCVDIEFAPESLGSSPMEHMMCLVPGGLRVEFIAAE